MRKVIGVCNEFHYLFFDLPIPLKNKNFLFIIYHMKRDKQIFIHNGNGKVQYQFLEIDFLLYNENI